jgi:hypothetical protein
MGGAEAESIGVTRLDNLKYRLEQLETQVGSLKLDVRAHALLVISLCKAVERLEQTIEQNER